MFSDYAAAVPRTDLVVGHSMGAITASLVARRDGSRVAYLAGLVPEAGATLAGLMRERGMICPGVREALERRDGLDHWTAPEAFGLDAAHLRGQAIAPYFEELDDPVAGPYVVCLRDRVVAPAYQRTVPLARVELDSGHDVFREHPAAVADLIGA